MLGDAGPGHLEVRRQAIDRLPAGQQATEDLAPDRAGQRGEEGTPRAHAAMIGRRLPTYQPGVHYPPEVGSCLGTTEPTREALLCVDQAPPPESRYVPIWTAARWWSVCIPTIRRNRYGPRSTPRPDSIPA